MISEIREILEKSQRGIDVIGRSEVNGNIIEMYHDAQTGSYGISILDVSDPDYPKLIQDKHFYHDKDSKEPLTDIEIQHIYKRELEKLAA